MTYALGKFDVGDAGVVAAEERRKKGEREKMVLGEACAGERCGAVESVGVVEPERWEAMALGEEAALM